jgi:hydroxypyruvate reductase
MTGLHAAAVHSHHWSFFRKRRELGLDPEKFITASDSYHYHEKTGSLLKTGPTGTNVCDIHIVLVV